MYDKYFTDTNVGNAYTFYPDKFHPSVKEKIDNPEKAWFGNPLQNTNSEKNFRKQWKVLEKKLTLDI